MPGWVDRVHADPVAEEGAPGAAAGRVRRDDGDAQALAEREPGPAHDLVGHRRLAGAPGPGDAEDRRGPPRPAPGGELSGVDEPALDARDGAGERAEVAGAKVVPGHAEGACVEGAPGPLEHVVHHPLEAHPLAVLGGVDAGDAVVVERAHLLRHDDPAAPAEDPHVPRPALAEHVEHVPEVLDVPALVGADRDRVHVLVDGGGHHLLDGAVVAEVDHLAPRPLEEAPHDVDRRVVAVEEARGGDEAKGKRGLVRRVRGVFGRPEGKGGLGHVAEFRRRSSKRRTVRNPSRYVNFRGLFAGARLSDRDVSCQYRTIGPAGHRTDAPAVRSVPIDEAGDGARFRGAGAEQSKAAGSGASCRERAGRYRRADVVHP